MRFSSVIRSDIYFKFVNGSDCPHQTDYHLIVVHLLETAFVVDYSKKS